MPTTLTDLDSAPLTGGRGVFSRILVGIDGSESAVDAARQAALLNDIEGELTLMAVWDISPTFYFAETSGYLGFDPEEQREDAARSLSEAFRVIAPIVSPTGKLIRGLPARRLIEEIEREQDTLVALGSRGAGSRIAGVIAGSVTTELVHDSPCSVLVARGAVEPFPSSVVVGVDGSPESAAAYAAACHLAKRFNADLKPIVARGGDVDERLVAIVLGERYEQVDGDPVSALLEASRGAGLVIVGSRGLHGLKAIGSVSERVAHQAGCSVLIVREPAWQRVREELTL